MQVIAFNSRIAVRPTMRTKLKPRLKEAATLMFTHGAAVEKSRGFTARVVFRPEDAGAEKWIFPGAFESLIGERLVKLSADWTYVAIPATGMFRMPLREAAWPDASGARIHLQT